MKYASGRLVDREVPRTQSQDVRLTESGERFPGLHRCLFASVDLTVSHMCQQEQEVCFRQPGRPRGSQGSKPRRKFVRHSKRLQASTVNQSIPSAELSCLDDEVCTGRPSGSQRALCKDVSLFMPAGVCKPRSSQHRVLSAVIRMTMCAQKVQI